MGNTTTLFAEIEKAGMYANVPARGSVMFTNMTQSQVIPNFGVDSDNYLISSITMIAPSPDWFSGFYNFDPRSMDTKTWYDLFSIGTYPWDAGTEEGDTYSTNNTATYPTEYIEQLTIDTIPESTYVFRNPSGKKVRSVARWVCRMRKS